MTAKILTADSHDEILQIVSTIFKDRVAPVLWPRIDEAYDLAYAIADQIIVGDDGRPIPATYTAMDAEIRRVFPKEQ